MILVKYAIVLDTGAIDGIYPKVGVTVTKVVNGYKDNTNAVVVGSLSAYGYKIQSLSNGAGNAVITLSCCTPA